MMSTKPVINLSQLRQINDRLRGQDLGSETRPMLNLWDTNYGIGVQSATFYCRSQDRFSLFKKVLK
jgi:hypothetical protein